MAKGVPNGEVPMKCGELGIWSEDWAGKCSDLKRFLSGLALRNATFEPILEMVFMIFQKLFSLVSLTNSFSWASAFPLSMLSIASLTAS